MNNFLKKNRFLILRRFTQISILALYFSANAYGLKILMGNLSGSLLFGIIPLSDPFAVMQMFAAGAILAIDVIIGAIIIALCYAIVGGRVFCSWVCPINIITDLANWLRRVLFIDKIDKKVWLKRGVRYWIIGIAFILSALTGIAAFEIVSPISMLHRGIVFGMGMGSVAVFAIFLFDLFVVKNGWCGHVCPLGGFYSVISKFSMIRVKHNQANCTLCMKCKEICPEKHILSLIGKESGCIVSGECTNCGRCIEVCDDDALLFGIRNYINKNS
ncbi:MAG: quinol dehydrogenase ferredoxin subunit NapH [Sulfurospirillum sp.]|nr:quinol dehydrogenase ferredoxin subunit NapH [Sulfurospirillum sp.]MBL0703333.1 quinol dehydrogenase ferredoxin subunit NapH [Sulfurospirillum sp.]